MKKFFTYTILLLLIFIQPVNGLSDKETIELMRKSMSGFITQMNEYTKKNKITLLAYIEGVDCSDADTTLFGVSGIFTCKIIDRSAYENSVAYFSQFLSTGMRETSENRVGDYFFQLGMTVNLTEKGDEILEFELIKKDDLPSDIYYLRSIEERWKLRERGKYLISKISKNTNSEVQLNKEMLTKVAAFKKFFPSLQFKRNSEVGPVYGKSEEGFYDMYIGGEIDGRGLKHDSLFGDGGYDGKVIDGKKYSITYIYYDDSEKKDYNSSYYRGNFEMMSTGEGLFGMYIINFTDNEISFVDIKNIPEFKQPDISKKNEKTLNSDSSSLPIYTRDEEYINQNRQYDFYYDENGNPVAEYLKEDYELLKKKYGNNDNFYGFVDSVDISDKYKSRSIAILNVDYYSFQNIKNTEGKDIVKVIFNKDKFIQVIKKRKSEMESIAFCSMLLSRDNSCPTSSPVLSDILQNKNLEKYVNKSDGMNKSILGYEDSSNLLISTSSFQLPKTIQIAFKNTGSEALLSYFYRKYSSYMRYDVPVNQMENQTELANGFQFDVSKDRETIIDFSIDNLLFDYGFFDEKAKGKKSGSYSDLYKDAKGNSYVKITGEKKIDNMYIYFGYEKDRKGYNCSFSSDGETINDGKKISLDCFNAYGTNSQDIKISIQPLFIENSIFINISDLFYQLNKIVLDKELPFLSIVVDLNNVGYFYFNYPEKDPLQFIDNIATPKTVSRNPFVIGINGIFALLYLLLFYFTGALFNSYFQEKGNELSVNKKIASYWGKFWTSMYFGIKKILIFLGLEKNNSLKKLLADTENFLSKRGHKVNVLIGIFILGVINSIIVGSFDLSSVSGWMVIGLLIFATGLLTLMKDMVLYILVKREDRGLKMELIPSGYILASMIAVFVRITNIVPGIIFGSAVRMNSETTTAKRKINNGRKLFAALLVAYIIGIAFWFSSIYIPEENLLNKFVLLNYFSISTDTFFTLLPFGLFWGASILKDKKFKPYWFVFIFFATFTLFHTVFNTKGDFSQILSLQSHNMNLFLGTLCFWLLILGGFWYFHFHRKIKKVDYSF